MKISTETYQYQSYSGQYERFASRSVQPDDALLIDAIVRYSFIISTLQKDTLNLLIALIKSPIDPTDINGQKIFFLKFC